MLSDHVVLAPSKAGAAKLVTEAAAIDFVRDAFGHLKVIGYLPEAAGLLKKAGVVPDAGVIHLADGRFAKLISAAKAHRIWAREPSVRSLISSTR